MIGLISAPTNLGLRPPVPGGAPGASKGPEVLREAGLHQRLLARGAVDEGTVLPGRYVAAPDLPPETLRNQASIVDHSVRLAARIGEVQARGRAPLIIGGDCSLLIGTGLAMSRRGRHGLVHIDGHTDFRHPGNSDECASLAGEDLAAASRAGRQVSAVTKALQSVALSLVDEHIAHCVANAVKEGGSDADLKLQ